MAVLPAGSFPVSLIVQKYGGTSMGSPERIREVARRVERFVREGHQLVVVVSAMSGETNRLIALANEVNPEPDPRELDVIVSTGEQVTIGLLCDGPARAGREGQSYTGCQVKILTDSAFTKARILSIDEAQHPRAIWTRDTWSSSRAFRASTQTATSPRWDAAARIPPAWRSPRR